MGLFSTLSEIITFLIPGVGRALGVSKCQVIHLLTQLGCCLGNLGYILAPIGCLFIDLENLLFKEIWRPETGNRFLPVFFIFQRKEPRPRRVEG